MAPLSLTDLVFLGARGPSSVPRGTAGAVQLVILSDYQLPLAPDPEELPPPNPPELDEELYEEPDELNDSLTLGIV
jgi:hypothetical protein